MKTYFTIITVIILTSSVFAQVSAGLIGGLNYAHMTTDNSYSPDFDETQSFQFGAIIEISLQNNLSLQTTPMYIEKENRINFIGPVSPEFSLTLSYIEIPLLLKYTVGNKFRPYIAAGPSMSINLSSEIGAGIAGFSMLLDSKNITSDVNFGFVLCTGINYELERITLVGEAKYLHTLNQVSETGNIMGINFYEEFADFPKLNMREFQFNIGFLVPVN